MSDVSNNLVYPTTEWDEIWEKMPNDLKILVSKELIDLNDEDVEKIQIKKTLPGKKISSVEILVKVDNE